jgi:hypothetical protein
MRRIIGLLIFGCIFGLTNGFCAGSMEAMRLAEGVNFDNQSEVITYATALKKSEAVIAQAKEEGISVDIWIKTVVGQMTESYHSAQKAEAEKQAKLKQLTDAELWSSRNVSAGAILLDAGTQKAILDDYSQNKARGEKSVEKYIGKVIQYTGRVYSVNSSYGIYIHLSGVGNDRITLFADIKNSETSTALALNKDEVITVVGECSRFHSSSSSDNPSIDLKNSSIIHIAK